VPIIYNKGLYTKVEKQTIERT